MIRKSKSLFARHQRVDELDRRRQRHVLVDVAVREEQLALQVRRERVVRLLLVVLVDRPSHPLLVPGGLVHAIVVATRRRHRHLVELGMRQDGVRRVVAARRVPPHADAREIHVRILRRHLLEHGDVIVAA